MSKDSFVFHRAWYDAIKDFDGNVRLEIMDAIISEAFGLDNKEMSSIASIAMKFILPQIKRDKAKYDAICRRNAENGGKGGRPRKTQNNPNNPNNPVGFLETPKNPEKPKKADNDILYNNEYNIISNNIEKEEDTNVSKKKKENEELFEECWKAYNRKGKKKKSFEQWKKLSEDECLQVMPHIRQYVASRELQFQQDFERYLRDRTFKEIIVKGNSTLYDPEQSDEKEYHPTVDGVFLYWDEKNKRLIFNGDIEHLDDGYASDNRPDGATAAWGMYQWKWNKSEKKWIKQ